ncbi:hypothetical protein RRG08_052040 [Elysia crispata]|uniref:Uncharacterized protein n=1 Tax=Elysia crispata TaxID=231223 RepID=A0AAE1A5Z8_9GAST|nr:hypothetical protein RRG08_052040 [Elysia crispata]
MVGKKLKAELYPRSLSSLQSFYESEPSVKNVYRFILSDGAVSSGTKSGRGKRGRCGSTEDGADNTAGEARGGVGSTEDGADNTAGEARGGDVALRRMELTTQRERQEGEMWLYGGWS